MTTEKKITFNWEPLPDSPVKMTFEVNQRQYDKFMAWFKDVSKRAAQKQYEEAKARNFEGMFDDLIQEDDDYPYAGAIGGTVDWIFGPTSIGYMVKAKYYTGEEIDLTEYENW